ncbi:MAG: hypothetical protein Q8P03_02100 [bacterium]|nr:hypothetical protein [bacterium]
MIDGRAEIGTIDIAETKEVFMATKTKAVLSAKTAAKLIQVLEEAGLGEGDAKRAIESANVAWEMVYAARSVEVIRTDPNACR